MSYVYVVAFTDGRVKLGRTESIVQRMKPYYAYGAALGNPVAQEWSGKVPSLYVKEVETAMLLLARVTNGAELIHGREWFQGLPFEVAVQNAQRAISDNGKVILGDVVYKLCTKCDGILPTSEFYVSRNARDGFQGHCKTCMGY